MTILGELVLPHGRSVWTQTLITTMELLGIRDKAARQAIARMYDSGWLDRTKVGRQTRWTLTDHAVNLLEPGAKRIYGFGQQPREWDGRWLMVFASVPERDRSVRYRMGLGLSWAGFGSLGQGTWLTPWCEQEDTVVALLADLGVEATSFIAELGQLGSAEALAEAAWDLPALRSRYDQFLQTNGLGSDPKVFANGLGSDPGNPSGSNAFVLELVTLVHQWRRFPFLDPSLPTQLLPADWPGPRAALQFAEAREQLLPAATAWWKATEAEYTP